MFGNPEYFSINEMNEIGINTKFIPAYGLIPYFKRLEKEELVGLQLGLMKGENVNILLGSVPKIRRIYSIRCITPYDNIIDEDIVSYNDTIRKNTIQFGDRLDITNLKEVSKNLFKINKDDMKKLNGVKFDFVLITNWNPSTEYLLTKFYDKLDKKSLIAGGQTLESISEFRDKYKIRDTLHTSKNSSWFWYKNVELSFPN